MNILDVLMQAQGGQAASQLGSRFGLDEKQTQSALGALLPSLAGAVKQNANAGGMDGLLGALAKGNHQRYLENPATLNAPDAVADGNGILGHLLGSKEVSRKVAANASAQTGIGSDVLKQMLPMVAAMMMGGLSKQASQTTTQSQAGGGGLLGAATSMLGGGSSSGASAGGGLLEMLTPMLDQNNDGSSMDDVLRMASGFLRK